MASASLLAQIRSLGIAIDVDSMDPQVAVQYGPFRDMTSNQIIVFQQAIKPESASLLKEAVDYVLQQNPAHNPNSEEYIQDVVDVLVRGYFISSRSKYTDLRNASLFCSQRQFTRISKARSSFRLRHQQHTTKKEPRSTH
jgi:hypothetical protein